MDENEQLQRDEHAGPTPLTAADSAGQIEKPAFRWAKFIGYLGSFVVVAILLGSAVAFWYGRKPLERRAQELAIRITRVEFNWPVLGEQAAKSSAVKSRESGMKPEIVEATRPTPGDKRKAAKKPALAVEPLSVPETPAETSWLPEQFQEQLISLAKETMGDNADPLSREPLDRVAEALEATGWFVGRPGVFREPEGVLRVQAAWRIPAAVVRRGATDQLVSWDGYPMPVTYKADQSKLPVIHGVITGGPDGGVKSAFSRPWEGEEVSAALELLRLLSGKAWTSQVAGIDVKDLAATKRLTIMTRRGGRVIWGGRASKPLWGEISTASKLDRLAELQRKFNSIDANVTEGSALEIYWERPLVLNISASNTGPLVEEPLR